MWGVECLRQGWPEGLWVLGEGAPALLPEAAHFPLGSVTSCLGRGEEEAAWVGGPVLREGSGKVGCCWVAALRGSSLSPGAAPLAFSGEDPQRYQGRGPALGTGRGREGGGGGSRQLQMGFSHLHSYRAPTFSSPSREMSSWVSTWDTIGARVLWELLEVLESAFKCWVSFGKSLYSLGLNFPIERSGRVLPSYHELDVVGSAWSPPCGLALGQRLKVVGPSQEGALALAAVAEPGQPVV